MVVTSKNGVHNSIDFTNEVVITKLFYFFDKYRFPPDDNRLIQIAVYKNHPTQFREC